jgi:hypothetical protein
MNTEDEKLLEDNGWEVECESPFEISTKDGCFARGQAANIILNDMKYETIQGFSKQDMKDSFFAGINRGVYIAAIITKRDLGEEFPSYEEYMKKFNENE